MIIFSEVKIDYFPLNILMAEFLDLSSYCIINAKNLLQNQLKCVEGLSKRQSTLEQTIPLHDVFNDICIY